VYACVGACRFCQEEAPTGPRNYKGSLAHAQQDACAVAAQQVRELDMYAGAWRLRPWKKQQLGLAVTRAFSRMRNKMHALEHFSKEN